MSMCGYCTTPQACAANGCAYLANRPPHDLDARALKARLEEAEKLNAWWADRWAKMSARHEKLEAVATTARVMAESRSKARDVWPGHWLDLRDALAALDTPAAHDGDGDAD